MAFSLFIFFSATVLKCIYVGIPYDFKCMFSFRRVVVNLCNSLHLLMLFCAVFLISVE